MKLRTINVEVLDDFVFNVFRLQMKEKPFKKPPREFCRIYADTLEIFDTVADALVSDYPPPKKMLKVSYRTHGTATQSVLELNDYVLDVTDTLWKVLERTVTRSRAEQTITVLMRAVDKLERDYLKIQPRDSLS